MDHFSIVKHLLYGGIISLGFIVLDAIWLKSLPWLDVSFGPALLPLFMLSIFRILIFVAWLALAWIKSIYPSSSWLHLPFSPILLLAILNFLILGIGLYAFCVEPFHLTVSYIEISVPGLKQAQRIVQLSDLHVEFTTAREREVSTAVANLHPDMIVMTGDYVNESYINDPQAVQDLRDLLGSMRAPLGIFAVNGNVEKVLWMRKWFSNVNIRVLDNEIVTIPELGEHFKLVGLSYTDWQNDSIVLDHLMSELQPQDFTLLLYHKPDLAYTARDDGVDLYLAGHTHGGQVRLPFFGALYSNSRFGKTFEMGLYHLGDMNLNVSRGLGFTGGDAPRIRFLCPPEVVVVDLVPLESR